MTRQSFPRCAHLAVAISAALFAPVAAQAALIPVDGDTCTLADAIAAANTDTTIGGCPAGSGKDTLAIQEELTLSEELPRITSDMDVIGSFGSPITIVATSFELGAQPKRHLHIGHTEGGSGIGPTVGLFGLNLLGGIVAEGGPGRDGGGGGGDGAIGDPSTIGGELALASGSGEVRIKLPARSLVCYPTSQLHQVREVTRGERLAVIGWIQSFVRDPQAREALYDLARARDDIHSTMGTTRAYDLVNKAHTNLLRRWAEN